MRTGITSLPLHGGHAPRWLFERMVNLSGIISETIVYEYGKNEFLSRISDPRWFQAFSCVIGFDWHSSGTTTTTCGALKIALSKKDIGIRVAGGKGKASRNTISEIENSPFSLSDKKISKLKYASRMAAKVDSSCIQDGYSLYHHSFLFSENGKWAVVQQGMNKNFARRYQWISGKSLRFINEPHNAISCDKKEKNALDMTAKESQKVQKISLDLVKDNPAHLVRYVNKRQKTLFDFGEEPLHMPIKHQLSIFDLNLRDIEFLKKAYEFQPKKYEEFLSLEGIGPKKVRALALISEIIYGEKPSWQDPAKYSFAHGGKDGYPYPVNRDCYDSSINLLEDAIRRAKIGEKDKLCAIKRLGRFITDK